MYPNNYYSQTPQTAQYPRPVLGLKGRPVSSIEEVRASGIDFDGSIFYFPDLANRRIYTKQINVDGTAILNMYELKELPKPMEADYTNYITRQEFNEAMAQLRELAQTQIKVPELNQEVSATPTYTNF